MHTFVHTHWAYSLSVPRPHILLASKSVQNSSGHFTRANEVGGEQVPATGPLPLAPLPRFTVTITSTDLAESRRPGWGVKEISLQLHKLQLTVKRWSRTKILQVNDFPRRKGCFLPCSPLNLAHKAAGTAEFAARKSLWQAELQTQEIFTKN